MVTKQAIKYVCMVDSERMKEVFEKIEKFYPKKVNALYGFAQYVLIATPEDLNQLESYIGTKSFKKLINYLDGKITENSFSMISIVEEGIKKYILSEKSNEDKETNNASTSIKNGVENILNDPLLEEKHEIIYMVKEEFPNYGKANKRFERYVSEDLDDEKILKKIIKSFKNKPDKFLIFMKFLDNLKKKNNNKEYIENGIINIL